MDGIRLQIERIKMDHFLLRGLKDAGKYLDTCEEVAQAIRYVEQNPVRMNLRRQRWLFVTP